MRRKVSFFTQSSQWNECTMRRFRPDDGCGNRCRSLTRIRHTERPTRRAPQ